MKRFTIYIFLILSLLLQGCSFNDPKYINFSEKSSPDFYTKEIYSKLLNDEEYSIELFNTNFYKILFVPYLKITIKLMELFQKKKNHIN